MLVPRVEPVMVMMRAVRVDAVRPVGVRTHSVMVRTHSVTVRVHRVMVRMRVAEPVVVAGVVVTPVPVAKAPMMGEAPVVAALVPGHRRLLAAAPHGREAVRGRRRARQGAARSGWGRGRRRVHERGEHVRLVRRLGMPLRSREDAHLGAHDAAETGDRDRARCGQRDRAQDGVHRRHGGAEPDRRDHSARPGDHPRPCRFPACEAHG
jgi:hypothetical protein